jgi:hypothetical protein
MRSEYGHVRDYAVTGLIISAGEMPEWAAGTDALDPTGASL